jgi:hypothetical protein
MRVWGRAFGMGGMQFGTIGIGYHPQIFFKLDFGVYTILYTVYFWDS